jgi:hypothetical protein
VGDALSVPVCRVAAQYHSTVIRTVFLRRSGLMLFSTTVAVMFCRDWACWA